jgi:hypothetical protein
MKYKKVILPVIVVASIYSCGQKTTGQHEDVSVKQDTVTEKANAEPNMFDVALPNAQGSWSFEKTSPDQRIKMEITIKGDEYTASVTLGGKAVWGEDKDVTHHQSGKLFVKNKDGALGSSSEGEDWLGLKSLDDFQVLKWNDSEKCLYWTYRGHGAQWKGCCTKQQ